jgi:hypothetical protein
MTHINITSGVRPLVRIAFENTNTIQIETNLSQQATGEVIGVAMEKFARAAGQEEQARAELAQLRARDANTLSIARAMAMMISEMNAVLKLPEIDVDVGEWVLENEN